MRLVPSTSSAPGAALEPSLDRVQAVEVVDAEFDARARWIDPPARVLDLGGIDVMRTGSAHRFLPFVAYAAEVRAQRVSGRRTIRVID